MTKEDKDKTEDPDLKKYVYKITYDDVVIGDTIFFGPRVQRFDYNTGEPRPWHLKEEI